MTVDELLDAFPADVLSELRLAKVYRTGLALRVTYRDGLSPVVDLVRFPVLDELEVLDARGGAFGEPELVAADLVADFIAGKLIAAAAKARLPLLELSSGRSHWLLGRPVR